MLFGINPITHSNLKVELEDLKKQVETLRSLNDQFKKRIDGEFSTASFAIDWDAMQVFSIERNMSCGYAHTILGYMLSEPVIHTEEKIMAQKKIPVANKQTRIVGGEKVTPCELLGPTVIDLVQAGMTPSRAAEAAGLVKSTVSKWISRGLEEQFKIEKGDSVNAFIYGVT
jgi:hypothetical protein